MLPNLTNPDCVWINHNLYCKNPEALADALQALIALGYNIKDCRADQYDLERGITPEKKERVPWTLWFATVDVNREKCNSCNGIISPVGSRMHGHTCELCGAVTYRHIVDGSTVRFKFLGDEYQMFGPELYMTAKRWDTDENLLYLHLEFHERWGGPVSDEAAWEYLDRHADKWDVVVEDGEPLLHVRYVRSFMEADPDAVISMSEIMGHEFGSKSIKVWDGKEYGEYFDPLPVPESVNIYESWHWAPLRESPDLYSQILHAVGQTDRKDYWCQDGRQAYDPKVFVTMGIFVRHFTTLDADRWDRESKYFPLDGPGGIDAVAHFCDPTMVVQTKPNIGNFLSAFSGLDTSRANVNLAAAAVQDDPDTQLFINGLTGRKPTRQRRN